EIKRASGSSAKRTSARRRPVLAHGERTEDREDDRGPYQRRRNRVLHWPRVRLRHTWVAEQHSTRLDGGAKGIPLGYRSQPRRHLTRVDERVRDESDRE